MPKSCWYLWICSHVVFWSMVLSRDLCSNGLKCQDESIPDRFPGLQVFFVDVEFVKMYTSIFNLYQHQLRFFSLKLENRSSDLGLILFVLFEWYWHSILNGWIFFCVWLSQWPSINHRASCWKFADKTQSFRVSCMDNYMSRRKTKRKCFVLNVNCLYILFM